MKKIAFQNSSTKYDPIILRGGLDLVTPLLQLKAGYLRDALNWEQSINGGYSRIGGYERTDGRPAPSAAVYLTLTVTISAAINVGDTITGLTSGAMGKVVSMTTTGAASQFFLAFTKSTGNFLDAESVQVAGITKAVIDELGGVPVDDISYDVTQTNLAADVYRADITAVPGSGPIRGVERINSVTYAWRDNVGATALAIYKSTGAGWTLVPLMEELSFTLGTSEYTEGETVSQGGVSAIVRAVALESGIWGSTAAGRLIISNRTGGNFGAGATAGGGAATAGGIQTAITLSPGGKLEFSRGNFGLGQRLYGVDGVNRAFQFDGTTMAPINSGVVPDVPSHVYVHVDHLFLSFGDNVQNQGIANPFNSTALGGAASWRVNGRVTSMFALPGSQDVGTLAMLTETVTEILYGNSAADFKKVPYEKSAGARPYGSQSIGGQSLAFSDIGVYSLTATQAFGNFAPSALTLNIRPFTQVRRTKCTASVVNREKSQYRVFFSDGFALYLTMFNNRLGGAMPMQFPNVVTCACQGESPDGTESTFFGSDNGLIYQMDAGTSFDGEAIDSFFTLTFAQSGNSRMLKRYRGTSFEIQGEGYAEFSGTYELNYASHERSTGGPRNAVIALNPVQWDTPSMVWDTFIWDGRSLAPSNMEFKGTGQNIAVRIAQNDDRFQPMTINSMIIHYSPRKALKKAA